MRSFILTTQAGKPAGLVDGVNDILLAVDPNGEGVKKTLWAQPFDQKGFFKAGDVQRMVLRDGKLVADGRVRVPTTFRATGATFAGIAGKGLRALAFVDEYSGIRIASADAGDLWRSAAPVGGGAVKHEGMANVGWGGEGLDLTAA